MREYGCKNCGKKIIRTKGCSNQRYCSPKCKAEFEKKKHPGKTWYLSPTKTPAEQCERCIYGIYVGGVWCCGYFDIEGHHARIVLHPEGLPDDCQEFQPRTKKRKPVSRLIIRR